MVTCPKNKIAFIVPIVVAGLTLLLNCGKAATSLIQNSEAKSPSGWLIKVVTVSQPATVNIKDRSSFGGTLPEKATSPAANQSWVQVNVEMTPPSATTPLSAKQIKLMDGSNSYLALAMASAPDTGEPAFIYFKDSSGLAQLSADGQIRWAILNNKSTGDLEILFQKPGSEKVSLLFAVPSSAKSLSLQIS